MSQFLFFLGAVYVLYFAGSILYDGWIRKDTRTIQKEQPEYEAVYSEETPRAVLSEPHQRGFSLEKDVLPLENAVLEPPQTSVSEDFQMHHLSAENSHEGGYGPLAGNTENNVRDFKPAEFETYTYSKQYLSEPNLQSSEINSAGLEHSASYCSSMPTQFIVPAAVKEHYAAPTSSALAPTETEISLQDKRATSSVPPKKAAALPQRNLPKTTSAAVTAFRTEVKEIATIKKPLRSSPQKEKPQAQVPAEGIKPPSRRSPAPKAEPKVPIRPPKSAPSIQQLEWKKLLDSSRTLIELENSSGEITYRAFPGAKE